MAGEFEYNEERQEIRMNCLNCVFGPSIEDYDLVMAITIDKLMEIKKPVRIVLAEAREHEYDFGEAKLLLEIAVALDRVIKEIITIKNVVLPDCQDEAASRYQFLQQFVNDARYDPIEAYKSLLREIRHIRIATERESGVQKQCLEHYMGRTLLEMQRLFENCEMIMLAKPMLKEHKKRKLYRRFFHPTVRPNFMYTHYMTLPPANAELMERYRVGDSEIEIYRVKGKLRKIYHLIPPEFRLQEEEYMLLDTARRLVGRHEPRETELAEPQRVRENLYRIGLDMLRDLTKTNRLDIGEARLKELAGILTRYTAGLGTMELLLEDENIQDIFVNSPVGMAPIYIYHAAHSECETNIIPSREDAESWATRFRLQSGRPLDEANPVLDTELSAPGGRARVAAITRTLSPDGLGFALRRHRDKPWTFPLFINNRMIDSFSAGLLWFLIDGARTLLIGGTRSSGKTAFLGACMTQIMPKIRIISVEDTIELPIEQLRELGYNIERLKSRSVITRVETELPAEEALRTALRLGDSALIVGEVRSSIRGNEEVLVVENGITKRIPIKDLEGKNVEDYLVPTLGFDLKVDLKPLAGFVKHPKREELLEITTKAGRKVTVTHDHSLFTGTEDFRIVPIECKDLKIGDRIVLPASIPYGFNDIEYINLLELLPEFRLKNFEPATRQAISKLGWKKSTEICNINSGDIYNYFRTNQNTNIPTNSFKSLMNEADTDYSVDELFVTRGTGNAIPAIIPVNEDFCRFLGYYVSEGYYSNIYGKGGNAIITNSDNNIIADVTSLGERLFKITPATRIVRGAGTSVQIRFASSSLAAFLSRLGAGRICTEKRVPPFIFGLSKEKIAAFLRGLYSGDGSFTASKDSGNCVRYFSTSPKLVEDVAYLLLAFRIVGTIRCRKITKGNDIWCVEFKDREMVETFLKEIGFQNKSPKMIRKAWRHTTANSIEFDRTELRNHLTKYPRRYRHLFRFLRCSKNYLKQVANDPECAVSQRLRDFANGEFFLDKIKDIREIKLEEPEFVYDLSVEPSQNFIGGFGGILLHNTEALALYEAMRIGALANVVAGTIHGESAYGVFDRLVNDLRVPTTSFKATDVVLIANMLRSPDGLTSFRRVVELTEVRKHWKTDPADENGFVNLLEYSAKDDILKPTKTLLTGESAVLNDIAARVREWRGNWDAVWDNINLRAKILQSLVDYAKAKGNANILEAQTVIESNSMFHLISSEVKEETGELDNKLIYEKWYEWLRKNY